ncbi:MAG: HD-GYP domain-containing protein [Fimbriimonadales bacterium]
MLKDQRYHNSTILLVDDEPSALEFLSVLLHEAGFDRVLLAHSVAEALRHLDSARPDLVLLDWHLGAEDSAEVIRYLRLSHANEIIPVIVLTADITPAVKHSALAAGASDFLHKPFDITEALLRIRNYLEMRRLYQTREHELELARLEILERLARAAEYRDDTTGQHIIRVGRLSEQIGRVLGLGEERLFELRHAAPLHDVGKIGVPDAILLKPARLTSVEWVLMRQHTEIGARILEGCDYPVIQMARTIALTHHERWDGTGYPQGLQGEAIPLWGRIVAVVDAYDAMVNDRPYRHALTHEQAIETLKAEREKQFDPLIVDAFLDPMAFSTVQEETRESDT